MKQRLPHFKMAGFDSPTGGWFSLPAHRPFLATGINGPLHKTGWMCSLSGWENLRERLTKNSGVSTRAEVVLRPCVAIMGAERPFPRWVQQRARKLRFATTEVQVSEAETPLHRLETVYRRMLKRLGTPAVRQTAFRGVIEAWFLCVGGRCVIRRKRGGR
jgi:hypothetical protein